MESFLEGGYHEPQNDFILPLDEGDEFLRLTASKTAPIFQSQILGDLDAETLANLHLCVN